MINIQKCRYQIVNGKTVYHNLNLRLNAGEFVGLLGKNGAGKTTLLDLIMGIRPPSEGVVEVLGCNPIKERDRVFRQMGYMSQDIEYRDNSTIESFLSFHSLFYQSYDKEKERSLLDYFQIDDQQIIGSLSTGQRKKVQIVANLASRPALLLIDEITAVLDPETRSRFFKVLKEEHRMGMSIILATNIVSDLKGLVDKIWFVEEGCIHEKEKWDLHELFEVEDVA